jgi:DNA-binding response OmpR family regulator
MMKEMNNINCSDLRKKISLKGIKILIIDDDSELSNSIKFYFDDQYASVYCASNGQKGLNLFYEINPDIVLLDLNLPVIGGTAVIKEINRKSPDLPIIVISGTAIVQEAVTSLKAGAWDFISKPITNLEELELCVLKSLDRVANMKNDKRYKESLEKNIEELTEEFYRKIEQLFNK